MLQIKQEYDECGELEEFSWDLFPIVHATRTLHLDENGLPKTGTRILPGMIVVGKIGKTRAFDPAKQPSSLEIHSWPFEKIKARYGHMWRDTSLYADESTSGVVDSAYFQTISGSVWAVVRIR